MTKMSNISRISTNDLSLAETYSLAHLARRKSSSGSSRADLRQKLGTAQLLEALETVIRNSPPPSPQPSYRKPKSQQITWAALETPKRKQKQEVDEYGFAYDDEEDEDSLSLCRTASRSS